MVTVGGKKGGRGGKVKAVSAETAVVMDFVARDFFSPPPVSPYPLE